MALTGFQHGLGGLGIRLLGELRHRRDALRATGELKVTIAGFRPVRHDAESHKRAIACRVHARADCGVKRFQVFTDVIGRRDQHHIVRRVFQHQSRRQDRGGRIAPNGFDHHTRIRASDRIGLIDSKKPEILRRHNDWRGKAFPGKPLQRALKQAGISQKRNELFGVCFSG